MNGQVEILLVESNPSDAGLALRALKKHNLAHNVAVARRVQPPEDRKWSEGDPTRFETSQGGRLESPSPKTFPRTKNWRRAPKEKMARGFP